MCGWVGSFKGTDTLPVEMQTLTHQAASADDFVGEGERVSELIWLDQLTRPFDESRLLYNDAANTAEDESDWLGLTWRQIGSQSGKLKFPVPHFAVGWWRSLWRKRPNIDEFDLTRKKGR